MWSISVLDGSCWAVYVLMKIKSCQQINVFLYVRTIRRKHVYVNITGSDNKTIPKNIHVAKQSLV